MADIKRSCGCYIPEDSEPIRCSAHEGGSASESLCDVCGEAATQASRDAKPAGAENGWAIWKPTGWRFGCDAHPPSRPMLLLDPPEPVVPFWVRSAIDAFDARRR